MYSVDEEKQVREGSAESRRKVRAGVPPALKWASELQAEQLLPAAVGEAGLSTR